MSVITISRQLGSAGDYIAGMLVEVLSYKVASDYIAGSVASMLSCKLVNKHSIIVEAQRRGMIEFGGTDEVGGGRPPILERFIRDKSRTVYAMRDILREIAADRNAVIVGRGGNMELRNHVDVFNVRIIADLKTRISRIRDENGVGRDQAITLIKQSDKERSKYVKHFFLVDVSDPELYDIVINTSKITPDAAVRLIVQAERQIRGMRTRSTVD